MDVRTLRYFLAVAREENITRAAESLHIAQPSLSRQLMELEQELGKQLLVRGKRKITLTEEGVLLRKRAEEIVLLVEKTEREIALESGKLGGEVSIGGGPCTTVLQAAAALHQDYPGVQLRFFCGDAVDVTERLDHGSLDFAALIQPVDTLKYDYCPLPDIAAWGILMRKSDCSDPLSPVTREELLHLPLILHQRLGLQREISRWAGVEIAQLNIAATYNVVHGSAAAFVACGLGVCLTTDNLVENPLPETLCFRLLEPALQVHYALAWKRYPVFTKAAEAFLQEIKRFL